MVLGIAVAVAFLYTGTGQNDKERKVRVADSDRCPALCAVPSDAILVSTSTKASKSYVEGVSMVESLHYYSGKLYRLNVCDFGKNHQALETAKENAQKTLQMGIEKMQSDAQKEVNDVLEQVKENLNQKVDEIKEESSDKELELKEKGKQIMDSLVNSAASKLYGG
jgi:gas vesicle protein